MNVQHYKEKLLEIERGLSSRMKHASEAAADLAPDSARDLGDASVADIAASDHFTQSELDGNILAQVRDALRRIEDGSFGKCTVDGGKIETKRLEAVPWTPYCLEHQDRLEGDAQRGTVTPD